MSVHEGASSLELIEDVELLALNDGHFLVWKEQARKWKNVEQQPITGTPQPWVVGTGKVGRDFISEDLLVFKVGTSRVGYAAVEAV